MYSSSNTGSLHSKKYFFMYVKPTAVCNYTMFPLFRLSLKEKLKECSEKNWVLILMEVAILPSNKKRLQLARDYVIDNILQGDSGDMMNLMFMIKVVVELKTNFFVMH